ESLGPTSVRGEPAAGLRTDQRLVLAAHKLPYSIHRAITVAPRRVAEVPLRRNMPIGEETELAQWLVVKTRADASFRHDDDRLLEFLVVQLVERDKHQRPALARRRR